MIKKNRDGKGTEINIFLFLILELILILISVTKCTDMVRFGKCFYLIKILKF